MDADDKGAAHRWETLSNIIHGKYPNFDLNTCALSEKGIVIELLPSLTIGIWVMPDNMGNGYLEHFLAKLAPQEDPLWKHTEAAIEQLSGQAFCKFSPVRQQKALVHTWLAWQKEPGKRFGDAVKAGYFDANSPAADAFEDWIKNTFELETS